MADIDKINYNNNTYHLGIRESVGDAFTVCTNFINSSVISLNIPNFKYSTGGILNILFQQQGVGQEDGIGANALLNINFLGARQILYRNLPIEENLIMPDDLVTFVYSGTAFHIINIDRNTLPTADLFYKPGDTVNFKGCEFFGYLVANREHIDWTAPLQKPVSPSVQGYVVNSFTGCYAHAHGTTLLSNVTNATAGGTFINCVAITYGETSDTIRISPAGVFFDYQKNSGAWTTTTNLGKTPTHLSFASFSFTFI